MRILVSDLSDFLNLETIQSNIDAINEFVEQGNLFILATTKTMNYLAEELSMINVACEYYICNNGAIIFDQFFNVVYRKDVEQQLVRPIYNLLSDDDNMLETYIDTSHGYVKDTNKCANGIVGRPYNLNRAYVLLDQIERKYPEIHGHIDDNYLTVTDNSVNKSSALEYLLTAYNLNDAEVITTGVTIEDYELVKKYHGYTFENSIQDLKDISYKTVKDLKELIDEIKVTTENDEDYLL